jgi:hypothetical protein
MKIRTMIVAFGMALLFGAVSLMSQTDQPQGPPPPRDALGQLKDALKNAGAAALTTDQETAIQALIKQFREAHRPPSTPPQTGEDMTAVRAQHEADLAAFASSVLNVLTSDAQTSVLTAKLGEDGLNKLIRRLAGGPGGPGGPGRRGGPDGPPPDGPPPAEQ